MRGTGATAGVLLLVLGGGASHAIADDHGAKAVSIVSYVYDPATVTVHVGDAVTWTNKDSAPHTVTSVSGPAKLDSPELQKGESWTYTAREAGTYRYYCALHPDMKAQLIVEAHPASHTAAPTVGPTAAAAPAPSLSSSRAARTKTLPQAVVASPIAPPARTVAATPVSTTPPPSAPVLAGSTPGRTLDPDLLLLSAVCGAVATALLVLGRRVRRGSS